MTRNKTRLQDLGTLMGTTISDSRKFKGGVLVSKQGKIIPIITPRDSVVSTRSANTYVACSGECKKDKSKEKLRPKKWDYSYVDKA